MKVLQVVGLFVVLLALANGIQRQKRGYSKRNTLSSWFRNEDIDPDPGEIEYWCHWFSSEFFRRSALPTVTQRGYMCFKSQAAVKMVSWCRSEELLQDGSNDIYLTTTVLDSRASPSGICDIFDVTITAKSTRHEHLCFLRLLEGVLICVDDAELLRESEIFTLFPVIHPQMEIDTISAVNYIICSISMGNECPGPAKIISVVQPDEEFRGFSCIRETNNISPCLYPEEE